MRPVWNPETYRAPSGRVYTRVADADHGRILRYMKGCGTILEFNRDVSVASFDRIDKYKCAHRWPCWWLALPLWLRVQAVVSTIVLALWSLLLCWFWRIA